MLVEVPVEGGGPMIVEVSEVEADGALELASSVPGVTGRARQALQEALANLQPGLQALQAGLRAVGPQETTVAFGLKVGGETGLVVAKGTAEVNFTVTMTWRAPVTP